MDLATIAATAVGSSCVVHSVLMATFHVLYRQRPWVLRRGALPDRADGAPKLVSILKPLAGLDDDLAGNLESFAGLEGPAHEILLGVASRSDPAHRAAQAFVDRHPELDARVVVTDPHAALNPKVAQLVGLAAAARGDTLVTSDSNVRVRSDYLVHLLAPLADARCGLVTSVFAGTGERTAGAALENLQLAAVILPSVVLSTLGLPVTVGKSMAMRRRDLDRLGGFAAFGEVLAEDAVLGRRFAKAGMGVATSFVPVENRNTVGSVARTFERHSRWAKMRRALSPAFFAIEPLFSPLVVALAAVLASPSQSTLAALAVAALVQTVTALAAAWTIRGGAFPWHLAPLEVVRAFVMLGCWASAWISRGVRWRGNALAIGRGTVLSQVAPMMPMTPPPGSSPTGEGAIAPSR